MKLTKAQLSEISERAEVVTPGPWFVEGGLVKTSGVLCRKYNDPETIAEMYYDDADAEFIASARQDIPALLDHIAAIEAENKGFREVLAYVDELSDEFYDIVSIDGQPTYVLKEDLENYRDVIREITIVPYETLEGDRND